LVKHYESDGDLAKRDATHSLRLQLDAVSHFENKEASEKVVKHMEEFMDLLNHQQRHDLIYKEAYDTLKENPIC